ncbi:MAG: hypothetical protein PHG66_04895 [Candidatus Colwellbacteria bacterium]|nr:hypothetical protein [Candidatus Colwellbacteria bacterium]
MNIIPNVNVVLTIIMDRPTFFINGYPIRAGGVSFYSFHEGKTLILLLNTSKWYEDIGGKTEIGDLDLFCTISREVNEESNRLFEMDEIYQVIQKSQVTVARKSKYTSFYVEIPWFENTDIFGKSEDHQHNNRVVEWVDVSEISKIKRNPRLDSFWEKTMKKIRREM